MYVCLNRATAGASLSLQEFLDVARDAGFTGADVDLTPGVEKGAAALREMYTARNLRFGGWGLPDWRGDANKANEGLGRLQKQAKIARELNIDSCATWIMPSSDLPLMENWKLHVDRLKPAARILSENGLRLGLEFVAPYHLRRKFRHEFIFTPGQMLELADAVGPNVGLLVDCFHCHAAAENYEHLAQIPAEKIVLVHLNDCPDVPIDQIQDGDRLLPGEGAIDLPAFFAALKRAGYAGPMSLEVFSEDLRAMPARDAATKAWSATKKVLTSAGIA